MIMKSRETEVLWWGFAPKANFFYLHYCKHQVMPTSLKGMKKERIQHSIRRDGEGRGRGGQTGGSSEKHYKSVYATGIKAEGEFYQVIILHL